MANIYDPLILPAQLHAIPVDYQSNIFLFDVTSHYTAQQHVNKMSEFFELHEINEADVQMRLFAQTLTGDVKKWFKAFPTNHIVDLENFRILLIDRWGKKKNPLQILSEYENIRRGPNETIQDYCTRFNNIYNTIPVNLRPPLDLALIKFLNGFETDMAYQLRERNPQTFEEMQSVAVSVVANLLGKRARVRKERRGTAKDETSPSDIKIDSLAKSMERIMDRVENMEKKP